MSILRPSSMLLLGAGLVALAAAAQAQTRSAADEQAVKAAKRHQSAPPKPAAEPSRRDDDGARGHAGETDMITLQEPFRSGAATPVSITHGR